MRAKITWMVNISFILTTMASLTTGLYSKSKLDESNFINVVSLMSFRIFCFKNPPQNFIKKIFLGSLLSKYTELKNKVQQIKTASQLLALLNFRYKIIWSLKTYLQSTSSIDWVWFISKHTLISESYPFSNAILIISYAQFSGVDFNRINGWIIIEIWIQVKGI